MIPISELRVGQRAIISQFLGGPGFDRRVRTLGIREGKEVRMVTCQPLGGPVVLCIDRREITVGRLIAQRILVHPII